MVLRAWLRERAAAPHEVVFPNARGGPLSRDGIQYLLAKHLAVAQKTCPTLRAKRVSPHVLRRTTAMQLLQAGVDRSGIALWLGHESVETTNRFTSMPILPLRKNWSKRRHHPIPLEDDSSPVTACLLFSGAYDYADQNGRFRKGTAAWQQ